MVSFIFIGRDLEEWKLRKVASFENYHFVTNIINRRLYLNNAAIFFNSAASSS